MSNLLEIKNLTIGIHENGGEYTAVDGISYEVRRGEILGVVGESGCGKSITNLAVMGLLNDQLSVTGGEIIYREPPAKTAERTAEARAGTRGPGEDVREGAAAHQR